MPPRARVVVFVFDLSATGVVRNAVALAEALSKGFDVELVTCRAAGPFAPRVPVVELDGSARLGPWALARATARLRAYLRARSPLVAISAGNRGHPMFAPAAAGLPGLRRVYRFSNDVEHRRADGSTPRLKGLADAAQLAALTRSADRIVLVSPHLLSVPALAAAAAKGQAEVVPNGVDVARARRLAAEPCPHPWASDDGPPFVLGIGRLKPQKDFPTLVDAVALANRTRPLRLIVLGDGPAGGREALFARAEAAGLGGMVDLPGLTPNPFAWLRAAACFALPSLWEGSSNALLEALAVGTPVVASASAGAAAEVLGGGAHGLLVPPGDAPALADALLRQTGPDPLGSGDRAEAFSLHATLSRWHVIVAEEIARLT